MGQNESKTKFLKEESEMNFQREKDFFKKLNSYEQYGGNPERYEYIKEYRDMKFLPTPVNYTTYAKNNNPKNAEKISDMIKRLKKVTDTYFGDWDYSWLEQICLVGLGKKNIALTTFDISEDMWWFNHKSAFALLKYFSDLNCLTVPGHPHPIYMDIGSQIWYRSETKYMALCILRLQELNWEGYNLPGVYKHIIQGICFGYSKEKIAEWLLKGSNPYEMTDEEYNTALAYVQSFKN
jgi:hypothetical protein